MLNMLCNIIILEPSTSYYCDHMTVTVKCDCDVTLNPNSRSLSIESKKKGR